MKLEEYPLVSVVIPMHNAQDWIIGLLHSIVNQSYKNIEVVLVNDGSTDSSLELVTTFLKNFGENKIRVLNQENSGVSAARNEGVRHSKGDYLAFVDSDDIWLKRKIEMQVKEMINSNLGACACSYAIFKDTNLRILDVVHPDWSIRGVRNWLLFRSYGGLLSSTLMLRKDAFYTAGPFNVELSLSADIEFAWRLLDVTSVKLIKEPLVCYRLRPNQMHRLPDLLISESKRMIKIVNLFRSDKYGQIFLANLNLRLFLYCAQNRDIQSGLGFILKALKFNFLEVCTTTLRIILRRIFRKLKLTGKDLFLIPDP
jgi:glycosyltransferase involved in cell wall biosynthesis